MKDIPVEILEKAAAGDMAAFEEIYRAASGFVYTLALRITHDRTDAEDVAQEVFVKVYKNLRIFAFRSKFKTWLYRIAVNAAINRRRSSARYKDKTGLYAKSADVDKGHDTAAQGAAEKEDTTRLAGMLDLLNADQKACLMLREIEGLDYKAIAEALKIPINTVRSRLKRAREILVRYAKEKGLRYEM